MCACIYERERVNLCMCAYKEFSCVFLSFDRFTPAEIAFLKEYVKTMSPLAKAVDVLQGEASVMMGWLVPTITLLKSKLQHLRISSNFCGPLIDALQGGLEKRFNQMLKDPELIAAAILVPKFRTCDNDILNLGKIKKNCLMLIENNGRHFLSKLSMKYWIIVCPTITSESHINFCKQEQLMHDS